MMEFLTGILNLQYAVHGAQLVRATFRATTIFVFAARLTAPFAINHELEFVMAGRELERGTPLAVASTFERHCIGAPIVERARDEHRLRLRRVAGEINAGSVRGVAGFVRYILAHGLVSFLVCGAG